MKICIRRLDPIERRNAKIIVGYCAAAFANDGGDETPREHRARCWALIRKAVLAGRSFGGALVDLEIMAAPYADM